MKLSKSALAIIAASMAFVACNDDDPATTASTATTYEISAVQSEALRGTYADVVRQNYAAALADAQALDTAIDAFLGDKTEANFEAAKTAWITARESYGTTEAFRLSDGPIDRVDDSGNEGPEGLLNSWPMDESVVDYVEGDADAGVINDTGASLAIADLADANGGGDDETEVYVGYHAIEFLLWGQDNTDPSQKLAGQREYTDYTTADNADRRSDYLATVTDHLVENLEYLVDQWEEGENYDVTFADELSDEEVIANVLGGIAKFAKGELAGERMIPGLDLGSQEDEHSCFSDNTHRDIALNYEGIKNVYFGTYDGQEQDGLSFAELVEAANPTLATQIAAKFTTADAAVAAATTGDAIPFDNAILLVEDGGDATLRGYIETAITELQELGDLITEAASEFGVSVTAELD